MACGGCKARAQAIADAAVALARGDAQAVANAAAFVARTAVEDAATLAKRARDAAARRLQARGRR